MSQSDTIKEGESEGETEEKRSSVYFENENISQLQDMIEESLEDLIEEEDKEIMSKHMDRSLKVFEKNSNGLDDEDLLMKEIDNDLEAEDCYIWEDDESEMKKGEKNKTSEEGGQEGDDDEDSHVDKPEDDEKDKIEEEMRKFEEKMKKEQEKKEKLQRMEQERKKIEEERKRIEGKRKKIEEAKKKKKLGKDKPPMTKTTTTTTIETNENENDDIDDIDEISEPSDEEEAMIEKNIKRQVRESKKDLKKHSRHISNILANLEEQKKKSDILKRGYLTAEGIGKKKWRKYFFRLYHKKHHLKYYKDGADLSSAEGQIDLVGVVLEELDDYKGKKICFSISTKDKKEVYYFCCTKERERKEWMRDIITGSAQKSQIYSKTEVKKIGSKIERILMEYNYDKNKSKVVEKLRSLNQKYPYSLNVVLILSEFLTLKGETKEAIKILERQIVDDLKKKVNTIPVNTLKQQYQIHLRLGKVYQSLYLKEKKKVAHLKNAVGYFEMCRKIFPTKQEGLEVLGTIYDILKQPHNSVSVWHTLFVNHPERRDFCGKCIGALQRGGFEEKLLQFLVHQTEKDISVGQLFRETANCVSLRRLKKLYLKKADFYDWIPFFCVDLKYCEENYAFYLKRNSSLKQLSKLVYVFFETKSLSSTEMLLTVLYRCFPKISYKAEAKNVINVIFKEISKRVRSKKVLEVVLDFFLHVDDHYLSVKTAVLLCKNVSKLKKYKNYDIFFSQLIKLYVQKKMHSLLRIFEKIKDERVVPYLLSVTKHGDVEKLQDYRKKSCLCLGNMINPQNKDYISQELQELFGGIKNSKSSVEFKLLVGAILFKITKDKNYLSTISELKVKDIPIYLINFIDGCEDGDQITSLIKHSKDGKIKASACKNM